MNSTNDHILDLNHFIELLSCLVDKISSYIFLDNKLEYLVDTNSLQPIILASCDRVHPNHVSEILKELNSIAEKSSNRSALIYRQTNSGKILEAYDIYVDESNKTIYLV